MSNNYIMTSEQNEARFQEAYDDWARSKENKDVDMLKNSYDTIWLSVQFACENIAKAIYTKRNVIVSNDELSGIVIDSTIYVMKFINKGVRPNKLSSYCYLRVRRFIDEPKKVWADKNIIQFPVGKEIEDGRSE